MIIINKIKFILSLIKMRTSFISLLCLFLSISLVSCQQIDIADVSAISDNLLGIGMILDDITSDITAILNVEVSSETELVATSLSVNILANTLFQDVTVDVGANINLNDGEVAVKVDILDIISLDLDVDIGDNIVGNLLDGVLEQASGLLQNLLSGLFSNADATIEIIDSQLVDGEIQVSLKLLDNVRRALPIELNVEIMVGSELLNLDTSVATFSGNRNEVVQLNLDLSLDELANIDLDDIEVSVQVSLSVLNLLDVNIDVGVELEGLNELLDVVLDVLRSSSSSSSNAQVAKSVEISDVSLDSNNILTATIEVDGAINADLTVDVHLMLFGNTGTLLNLDAVVSLAGIDGETADVTFDLSAVLNGDIEVFAAVSLSDLNISANIDVSLGDLELLSITDGVLNDLLGNLLGNL